MTVSSTNPTTVRQAFDLESQKLEDIFDTSHLNDIEYSPKQQPTTKCNGFFSYINSVKNYVMSDGPEGLRNDMSPKGQMIKGGVILVGAAGISVIAGGVVFGVASYSTTFASVMKTVGDLAVGGFTILGLSGQSGEVVSENMGSQLQLVSGRHLLSTNSTICNIQWQDLDSSGYVDGKNCTKQSDMNKWVPGYDQEFCEQYNGDQCKSARSLKLEDCEDFNSQDGGLVVCKKGGFESQIEETTTTFKPNNNTTPAPTSLVKSSDCEPKCKNVTQSYLYQDCGLNETEVNSQFDCKPGSPVTCIGKDSCNSNNGGNSNFPTWASVTLGVVGGLTCFGIIYVRACAKHCSSGASEAGKTLMFGMCGNKTATASFKHDGDLNDGVNRTLTGGVNHKNRIGYTSNITSETTPSVNLRNLSLPNTSDYCCKCTCFQTMKAIREDSREYRNFIENDINNPDGDTNNTCGIKRYCLKEKTCCLTKIICCSSNVAPCYNSDKMRTQHSVSGTTSKIHDLRQKQIGEVFTPRYIRRNIETQIFGPEGHYNKALTRLVTATNIALTTANQDHVIQTTNNLANDIQQQAVKAAVEVIATEIQRLETYSQTPVNINTVMNNVREQAIQAAINVIEDLIVDDAGLDISDLNAMPSPFLVGHNVPNTIAQAIVNQIQTEFANVQRLNVTIEINGGLGNGGVNHQVTV